MSKNRDLLKEAIADAKTVKETAIANAKMALEEAFTPYLKEKLSAKLNEMEEEEELEVSEEVVPEAETSLDDEVSLDELLAELEGEETNEELTLDEAAKKEKEDKKSDEKKDEKKSEKKEAKKDEDDLNVEEMSEDDLKSFIEGVIKDMVEAGELEAGHEEGEESEDEVVPEKSEVPTEAPEVAGEEEEVNIDELLSELEGSEEAGQENIDFQSYKNYVLESLKKHGMSVKDYYIAFVFGSSGTNDKNEIEKQIQNLNQDQILKKLYDMSLYEMEEYGNGKPLDYEYIDTDIETIIDNFGNDLKYANFKDLQEAYKTIENLKKEINEVNLLNVKLLYTNKIFRAKSLTEAQKIKVLSSFDKATTKKEAQLIYETLLEGFKTQPTKSPIKESLIKTASTVVTKTKPIIENDAFARMRELAGIKQK